MDSKHSKITWKDAKKLGDDVAPLFYRGSALTLLQRLIKGTYSKADGADVQRPYTRTVPFLRRGLGLLTERQFRNLINGLKDDGVLVDYTRDGNNITYTLSLQKFLDIDPVEEQKARKQAANTARSEQARATVRKNRDDRNTIVSTALAALKVFLSPIPEIQHPARVLPIEVKVYEAGTIVQEHLPAVA